ncbi:4-hydroxy-tetrahydrodipicolinate synthase family protein [Bradyrhizobium canariense]|uniref:4-hydroxy-tetrahydrodipicolinate synthase n=1 Tax=Bradyrhizobium canariense TaxID=255045 RepID=A0A1H2AEE4_9BRAD|nr:4-hydroxy-tetrahydrodipicolinate synthase [Bradyrhizobium canariense]SDT44323.1 4-hydroxy-tetrahydrodipicolinate synthase [Bradyrhizobium canariense]
MTNLSSADLRSQLQGLWLPLVTPFRDGDLDETSLRRLVRHYARGPVDGLVLAATSGEGMALGIAELEQVVTLTRAEMADIRHYMPICLGLSGASTLKMLDQLDETAAWPIDGYLISSPYYVRPSQRGLLQHFSVLADHASWPIVLYNIPYRSAVNLSNETLLRLAEHPNIVGLKDCGADRAQSIDLLRRRPSGFRILTGEDTQYYDAISDGADGAILLSAHIDTEGFASVRTLFREGNRDAAQARWESISDLTRLLFAEPSPAPAKYWLSRTGLIDSAEVRLPMVEVSAELAARLDLEIEQRCRGVDRLPRRAQS